MSGEPQTSGPTAATGFPHTMALWNARPVLVNVFNWNCRFIGVYCPVSGLRADGVENSGERSVLVWDAHPKSHWVDHGGAGSIGILTATRDGL